MVPGGMRPENYVEVGMAQIVEVLKLGLTLSKTVRTPTNIVESRPLMTSPGSMFI
jgi:hypothetical protein